MNYINNIKQQLKEGRIVIKKVFIRKKSERARKYEKDIVYETYASLQELKDKMYDEVNKVTEAYKEQAKKVVDEEYEKIKEQYKRGGNGIEIVSYYIQVRPGSYEKVDEEYGKMEIIE